MKTNKVMIREMGEYKVHQRTKDAMFNMTSLQNQWNENNTDNKKYLNDYWKNKSTNELINTIIDRENLDKENSPYVKSKASRGINSGTWAHPILFIDFAMWLNPKFKYDVIKFVYDRLIEFRIKSCDSNINLNSYIQAYHYKKTKTLPNNEVYTMWAKFIQKKVLGQLKNNAWENATEEELQLRNKIQEIIAKLMAKEYSVDKIIDSVNLILEF